MTSIEIGKTHELTITATAILPISLQSHDVYVHNLVSEYMALKEAVELVIFQTEPLKPRLGLLSDNFTMTSADNSLTEVEKKCLGVLNPTNNGKTIRFEEN